MAQTSKARHLAASGLAKAGEGGRTLDIHVGNEAGPLNQPARAQAFTDFILPTHSAGAAEAQVPPPCDPDLTAVVTAWPTLPDALRAGILAMVKAADG